MLLVCLRIELLLVELPLRVLLLLLRVELLLLRLLLLLLLLLLRVPEAERRLLRRTGLHAIVVVCCCCCYRDERVERCKCVRSVGMRADAATFRNGGNFGGRARGLFWGSLIGRVQFLVLHLAG